MYQKYLITLFFLFVTTIVSAQNIRDEISLIKNSPGFKSSSWGFYAEFADNGEEIINYDGHLSLGPASNLKLVTSSAALHWLGEEFKFQTNLYISGEIKPGGILEGDIIIEGGGDPTLGSIQVKGSLPHDSLMKTWTDAVLKKGIKKINGTVIGIDEIFNGQELPDYYPWIDMGNYYGASTSALTIHDNLYYLYFKPGKNKGDIAEVIKTYPTVPGLNFTNYMKTGPEGSGDNGYIYASPKQFNAVLKGTIPAGVNEFSIKGSIPDPPLFAAQYLKEYLLNAGINVADNPYVINNPYGKNMSLIHTTVSPPLKDIVYIINKKSNNLYTEQVLKMSGYSVLNDGSFEGGINAVKKFLDTLRINDEGFRIFDGSGLSRNNMVTPLMMGKMLSAITKQTYFKSFYNSLGIAGDPEDISSFKNFGPNTILAFNARVKSGTVNGVRAHSGYVTTKKGRLVSFSFIANNFTGSSGKINETHVKILKMIAEQN